MDENKLNELFYDILNNKLQAAPPSSYSPSEYSTLESSLNDETYIEYEDVMNKLKDLIAHLTAIRDDAKLILLIK
jgi:hypothetical protein